MNKAVDLSVELCGIRLKNPVIAASGTFGFGREYSQYTCIDRIGGIAVKGITLKPRAGNSPPRMVETPSGILNSIGLENPGVEAFVRDELPFLLQYDTRIIANIAGDSLGEYLELTRILNSTRVDFIELNISCPNVDRGCLAFGSTPEGTLEITRAVTRVSEKPVMVKLSPNVRDIGEIARAAQQGGASCLSLINTLTGMVIDPVSRTPILGRGTGGLSGPAIRPVALRMTYETCRAVNIPVVSMGGITCAHDALQFIIAGAHAVMVGTWNFVDPEACIHTAEGMESFLKEQSLSCIGALRNTLKMGR